MQAVREDRSLIRAAFAETLRHTPPVLMVMREPDEDVEFQGVKIPAGSTVTAMCAAANRDPRVFKDPDDFNIFRTDLNVEKAFGGGANHMTFALGRHFCVGSILAMYEVERGTNQLLDAMEDIEFTSGEPPQEIGLCPFTCHDAHQFHTNGEIKYLQYALRRRSFTNRRIGTYVA